MPFVSDVGADDQAPKRALADESHERIGQSDEIHSNPIRLVMVSLISKMYEAVVGAKNSRTEGC